MRIASTMLAAVLVLSACSDDTEVTPGASGTAGTSGAAGAGGSAGSGGSAGASGSGGSAGTSGSAGTGGSAGSGGSAGAGGTGGSSGAAFALNDVSMLFPYDLASGAGMYRADDQAGHGLLLPQSMFESVGPISDSFGPAIGQESPEDIAITYPRLRVVAVRIDPCFGVIGSADCRRQIRMVFQPVTPSGGFDDAALHVFYDIPADEFTQLATAIKTLKNAASASSDGPLDVHPILKAEGANGAFATGLKSALFAHAGSDRITRITAMQLVQSGGTWDFRGFDFAGGVATPIGISGSTTTTQTIHNFGNTGFDATVTPPFGTDPDLSLFWSSTDAQAAAPAAQQAAFDATLIIENPNLRDVEHVSCVACHTALPARHWAEETLGLSAAGNTNSFTSSFDLSLKVRDGLGNDTTRLRAFGYRGIDPVLSQRVVNESAKVAVAVAALVP